MLCFSRHERAILCSALLVLSFAVVAADTPVIAAAANQKQSQQPLDLRMPPITEIMTPEQIDEVLKRTLEPRNIEEVEVDRSRIYDPESATYIPSGFAALFWAAGRPSGLWRLFTPRLVHRMRADIDPTNPARPAPGIPAMAGEERPYDR